MYKAVSRKAGILLAGFILLAWAAIVPQSLSAAGLQELSDKEMASVYAQGFSSFSLSTDPNGYNLISLNFSGVTLSTWTEMSALRMGYYSGGWDQEWKGTGPSNIVSLGSSGTDLVAQGIYINAGFSNITDPGARQLEYVHIGTTNLTGAITADFNKFTGVIGATDGVPGSGTSYTRSTLGPQTITSAGGGFYLSLDRTGTASSNNKMGYSFYFGTGSHL